MGACGGYPEKAIHRLMGSGRLPRGSLTPTVPSSNPDGKATPSSVRSWLTWLLGCTEFYLHHRQPSRYPTPASHSNSNLGFLLFPHFSTSPPPANSNFPATSCFSLFSYCSVIDSSSFVFQEKQYISVTFNRLSNLGASIRLSLRLTTAHERGTLCWSKGRLRHAQANRLGCYGYRCYKMLQNNSVY